MMVYNYDPATGRLLGATPADPDRERPGEWVWPAFSTPHEPPTPGVAQVAVFDRAADAWRLQVAPPAPPPAPPDAEEPSTVAVVRGQRDALLRACDWVVLRAWERGEPVPDAWAVYRQALRDVPAQEGFPDAINWPQAPTA